MIHPAWKRVALGSQSATAAPGRDLPLAASTDLTGHGDQPGHDQDEALDGSPIGDHHPLALAAHRLAAAARQKE